jgi:hypothetical protein
MQIKEKSEKNLLNISHNRIPPIKTGKKTPDKHTHMDY